MGGGKRKRWKNGWGERKEGRKREKGRRKKD